MTFPPSSRPRSPALQPFLPSAPPPSSPPLFSDRQNLGCGIVVFLTLLLLGKWLLFGSCDGPLPGVGPFPEPIQKPLPLPITLPAPPGFTIIGHHSYDITALILSRARYRFDKESFFSPVDLALGWGLSTLHPYVNQIEWSQSGRWYYYKTSSRDLPFPLERISHSSANTHIVPPYGDKSLQRTLLGFKRGDVVHLRGYLITILAKDGQFRWHSSTSRFDKGGGACEILYVTDARKLEPGLRSPQPK